MSRSESDPVGVTIALITAPDGETGARLGRALVEERLAACVNVVPGIRSFYRWEGRVQVDDEVLLIVKTRSDRTDALEARVLELHPYTVPEVLHLEPGGGSAAYLDWVRSEVAP